MRLPFQVGGETEINWILALARIGRGSEDFVADDGHAKIGDGFDEALEDDWRETDIFGE